MRIPVQIIPLLIVAVSIMGLSGADLFRIPSAEVVFTEVPDGVEPVRAKFIVSGVICRDTALTAIGNLAGKPGIYKVEAYASHNRIDVIYNADVAGPAAIGKALEDPVFVKETGEFIFDMFEVLEINGKRIEADASKNKED